MRIQWQVRCGKHAVYDRRAVSTIVTDFSWRAAAEGPPVGIFGAWVGRLWTRWEAACQNPPSRLQQE